MTTRIDPSLLARIPGPTAPWSRSGTPLYSFNLNQALQGRVLSVHGNQSMISLQGEQIAVESLLPLHVGQLLDLIVREVRPDRVTLQVVHKLSNATPTFRLIADQDMSDLLHSQQVIPDRANLLIARALINNSLPITKALVMDTRKALSFIETPTKEEIDAAIYLLLKDLSVTPESLELAKGALLQPNNLGVRVQTLAVQLIELLTQTVPGSTVSTLPRHLLTLIQQALHDLPLLVPDQTQGRAFAALVQQVVDQIATPTEHRLTRLIETPTRIPAGPDTRSPTAAKESATVDLQSPPSEDHLLQELPVLIRRRPLEVTRNLRLQLAFLDDELVRAATDLPRQHPIASLLKELHATIRDMLTVVEAEQLSNAGMPQPTQAQGYYVFHLPVAASGQDTTDTAELRLYYQRQHHGKRVDPENAHLALLLQMSHLGAVDVHVDLYHKRLRCRIDCTNQETAELFDHSSSELEERLEAVGFIVDSIRTMIVERSNAHSERDTMPSLFKIDIRA